MPLLKPVMTKLRLTCIALKWRHNGRDSVSNHQPHNCLLNRLFKRRSKKTSKFRVTGLCAGNSPVPGEFPAVTQKCFNLMTSSWNSIHTSVDTRPRCHEVLTAVLSLTWKTPYADKTVFILRRGPGRPGLFQASHVAPLKCSMDKRFHPIFHNGCNYMLVKCDPSK